MADTKVDNGRARIIEVLGWFAVQMRDKLVEPRCEAKGDWREDGVPLLLDKLRGELSELDYAIGEGMAPDLVIGECVDVANYAMMIADLVNTKYRDDA